MAKPPKIGIIGSHDLTVQCSFRMSRPPPYRERLATLLVTACLIILVFSEFTTARPDTLDYSIIGRTDSALNYVPVSGSVLVLFFGDFRLSSIGTPISRVGNSAFEATEFTSTTTLLCKSPAGQQKSMMFHLTVMHSDRNVNNTTVLIKSNHFTYEFPEIFENLRTNFPASGDMSLTVVGRGSLGRSETTSGTKLGISACGGSVWASDSGVVCRGASAGLGAGLRVAVSAGEQAGSLSLAASYDAASASSVAASNLPSSGGVSVTVVGRGGLGARGGSVGARIGVSACGGSVWASDSGVFCRGTSPGVGAGYGVAITSWSRVGSLSFAWSYNAVCLSAISVNNVSGTEGFISVVGCGGLGSMGRSAQVRIGGSACGASEWLSDSGILCRGTSAGAGAGLSVAVTAGLQTGSLSFAFVSSNNFTSVHTNVTALSYDVACLSSVSASNVPSSGRAIVTVVGRGGFGGIAGSARVRVRGTACGGSLWVSDSGILCQRTSAGAGAGLSVAVTAGLQTGSLSFALSYDVTCLSSVSASNVPSTGRAILNVHSSTTQ